MMLAGFIVRMLRFFPVIVSFMLSGGGGGDRRVLIVEE